MIAKCLLFFTWAIILLSYSPLAHSGEPIEISREFTMFTSQQASGFLKPLFTTIGESLNSGLYTKADYARGWSFGLDITLTSMIIPKSQTTYSAVLPDRSKVVTDFVCSNRNVPSIVVIWKSFATGNTKDTVTTV